MKWQKLLFTSNYSNFLLFTGVWPLLYWWIALFQGLFSYQQSQVVYKMIGIKYCSPLTCPPHTLPLIFKKLSQVWRNTLGIYGSSTSLSEYIFLQGALNNTRTVFSTPKSEKTSSIWHLAPLSPSESLEIWRVKSAPIILSISHLIAPFKVTLSGSHSGKFEMNEGPCPSPCHQQVLLTWSLQTPAAATALIQTLSTFCWTTAVASTLIVSQPPAFNAFPCSFSPHSCQNDASRPQMECAVAVKPSRGAPSPSASLLFRMTCSVLGDLNPNPSMCPHCSPPVPLRLSTHSPGTQNWCWLFRHVVTAPWPFLYAVLVHEKALSTSPG